MNTGCIDREIKSGWHDADDSERGVVQHQLTADDRPRAAEAPLPRAVAEDDDPHRWVERVGAGVEWLSNRWRCADHFEEVAGHKCAANRSGSGTPVS
jgi:hypothetical protein